MAHHVTPPPALPVGCISEIIDIVRNGRVRTDAACLYWCAMDLLAYGGGIVFGPPVGHEQHTFGSIGDEGERLDECLSSLEQARTELTSFGASEEAAAIDPITISLIIQAIVLAIDLIRRLRR